MGEGFVPCDFLKRKDFQHKIGKWYVNLLFAQKKEIKTFLARQLTVEELKQIITLSELDCSGNILINNLHAIIPLDGLKKINCSNTGINSLEVLANKDLLEMLDISYTAVTSLKPLENLPNIKIVKCYHTEISQKEIERFKAIKPNCEVLKNQSDDQVHLPLTRYIYGVAQERGAEPSYDVTVNSLGIF